MASDLLSIDENADWAAAAPGTVLATCISYQDLLTGISRRKEAVRFSHIELDERCALPIGYTAKLLCPGASKNLGPKSLGALLKALGLKIALLTVDTPVPLNPKRQRQGEAA